MDSTRPSPTNPPDERPSVLEVVLRRDRMIVLVGIFAVAALTWFYMAREARAMADTEICGIAGMMMSGPNQQAWSTATLVPLFLMWAEMMVAMMTPSVAPMLIAFATINRRRRALTKPFVPTAVFLGGYLAVWTGFSASAAIAQWVLHSTLLLSPAMVMTSPLLGGTLLIAAGIFQWTPLKYACLAHCRSPLGFLMTGWRDGKIGAFVMGVKHGAYCTGCCWFLMTLLFVAGVMNLWWIAAISLLVLLEKVIPRGLQIGWVAGLALTGWGGWMIAATL